MVGVKTKVEMEQGKTKVVTMVVVVLEQTRWGKETQPNRENQQTQTVSEVQKRKDETHQR